MLSLKTNVGFNSYDGKIFKVSSKGNITRNFEPKDKDDEQRLLTELFGLNNIEL